MVLILKIQIYTFQKIYVHIMCFGGFPGDSNGKESACNAGDLC